MLLTTKNKIYRLKFGLMGLILLREKPNNIAELNHLLYCGLISQHPNITNDEINDIIQENDLSFLEPPIILSNNELRELYTKAVGEMGITLLDFYNLTPEEIEWGYEGYLRRKETEANLIKIAIINSNNDELIRLVEDKGYVVGNLTEREKYLQMCYEEMNNEL